MLRYYPTAAQHKLGSPWIGPNQVVRQATGHMVGIQRDQQKPIMFVHVDGPDGLINKFSRNVIAKVLSKLFNVILLSGFRFLKPGIMVGLYQFIKRREIS